MTLMLLSAFGGWLGHAALPQAWAQTPPLLTGVNWSSLTSNQKAALEPLADRWPQMSPEHQRKWLAMSRNYRQLSPADQERLHARMLAWAKLSSTQRMQTRRNFGNAKGALSADERRARWDAFNSLDEDEREALARKGNPVRVRSAAPAVQPQPLVVKLPEPKQAR